MGELAPVAVIIPLLGAALLVALRHTLPRLVMDCTALAACLATAALLGVLTYESANHGILLTWLGGYVPMHGVAIGIALAVDPISGSLATLAAGLMTAVVVYAWHYFEAPESLFHALLLVFLGAMVGFVLSVDLFNLFVCFEMMSVVAYALTAQKIEEPESLEGGLNFAVVNTIGGILILLGIGLVYGRTGALNMAQVAVALEHGPRDALVLVSFGFICCGLFCKAAMVPFHFWLADAHAVAPTPVCVLFSGIMVELGLYGVARLYHLAFAGALGPYHASIREIFIGLGTASAITGGVMCLAQRHLKRMLAFSTISHSGVILLGIAIFGARALAGAGLYLIGHGLAKGALFMAVGVLLNRFGSVDENALHGKGRETPIVGVLFMFGGLALAGLPLFATSAAEGLLHQPMDEAGYGWLVWIMGAAAALTGAAVLRAAGHIFLGIGPAQNTEADTPAKAEKETDGGGRRPWLMLAPCAVLLAAAGALAFVPALTEMLVRGAEMFVAQGTYVGHVLYGRPAPVPPMADRQLAGSWESVVTGMFTTAAAVGLAAAALWGHLLPRRIGKSLGGGVQLFVRPLRWVHSGKVGDYCVWVAAGVVAVTAALLWGR